jgi:peptidyl-prolyl cis-trans isomerase-like protein 2
LRQITHSEWASEDAYSASAGSGTAKRDNAGASFKRLPFKFCALSLQPFTHPVCTSDGTIFDITNILPWLKKHGTNPVTGAPLDSKDLIKLCFAKNEDGEVVDPVTFKVLGDNTHIAAIGKTGNVFAYDTIERLNIKAKMWRDLVSDEEFSRKDIIVLQDPQNIEARNLTSFKYLQDGVSTLTEEQLIERKDPSRNVNREALGNAAAVLEPKKESMPPPPSPVTAIKKNQPTPSPAKSSSSKPTSNAPKQSSTNISRSIPYNAAQHTTGKAAASFTSTGLTPHTSSERAVLTDEEYMLKPRRVKQKGYARIRTNHGDLNIELLPEFAPRAVWNFVHLAKNGYYTGVTFHRNIRHFMLQGGDPTGTGKGGASVWGKNFQDEFDGPLSHDARGIVSMANKGKNTNSSQFFITYRPAKHLDRKHTIFGRVVGGMETLGRIENVKVTETEKRPVEDVVMSEVVVFVNPFEEFLKEKTEREDRERESEEIARSGGREDDRTTWTGKRLRAEGETGAKSDNANGVGKYLAASMARDDIKGKAVANGSVTEEWEVAEMEPVKKKGKVSGGFGNFDNW